jgi:hypothetical protein
VLGTAGILLPILSRLGFSRCSAISLPAHCWAVRARLANQSFPLLSWFTIGDSNDVAGIAELGCRSFFIPDRLNCR